MDQWSINLCVVDSQGHPVEWAAVAITDGPAPFPDIAALTDREGKVQITVPNPVAETDRHYRVSVSAPGHAICETNVNATRDDQHTTVRV